MTKLLSALAMYRTQKATSTPVLLVLYRDGQLVRVLHAEELQRMRIRIQARKDGGPKGAA